MKCSPRPLRGFTPFLALMAITVPLCSGALTAQISKPPQAEAPPEGPAFYDNWGPWFKNLTTYYQGFPKGKPFLQKDPKDAFDLGDDWTVQIHNHGILEHQTLGRNGWLPRREISYEVCGSWAIWKWSQSHIDRNEQVLLHATANWVSSKDVHITRENASYVEYEFAYTGGPGKLGTVELEAWWQMIAYAKADSPPGEDTAECSVHTAIVGSYLDGVGTNMDWNGGARSASTSGIFPVGLKLTLLGVGVSVSLTTAADGSEVITKSKSHRPKASKTVRGSKQRPAVITVQKHAATSVGARVLADAATAGPGSSILDFHCWFRGRFGSSGKKPVGTPGDER